MYVKTNAFKPEFIIKYKLITHKIISLINFCLVYADAFCNESNVNYFS